MATRLYPNTTNSSTAPSTRSNRSNREKEARAYCAGVWATTATYGQMESLAGICCRERWWKGKSLEDGKKELFELFVKRWLGD